MVSTRQLILEFLDSKQIGTAPEIARAINMTAANARHHLSILQKEGAVVVVGQHLNQERGRPSLLYALSAHTRQHNLDKLSSVLLTDVLSGRSAQEIPPELRRIAGSLLGEVKLPPSLTQRLYQAVQRLNEMQYQARWEARANAPTISFGFCPYAGILAEHPELCEMDVHVIEALLGKPARQVDKLARDERGAVFCRFMIQGE